MFRQILLVTLATVLASWGAVSDITAQPKQDPVNSHYYDFVPTAMDITWTEAKMAAESTTFLGRQGYLATITSVQEDDFLHAHWGSIREIWIGGSDADVEGDWRWVTGPEGEMDGGLGLLFWRGGSSGVPFGYTDWISGEPNNLEDEDYLGWNHNLSGWNDFLHQPYPQRPNDAIRGYFVEFVPEPSSGLSTIALAVTFLLTRRRQ